MGRKAAAVGADGNGKAAIVIVVAVSVVAPTGESNAGIVVLPLLELPKSVGGRRPDQNWRLASVLDRIPWLA